MNNTAVKYILINSKDEYAVSTKGYGNWSTDLSKAKILTRAGIEQMRTAMRSSIGLAVRFHPKDLNYYQGDCYVRRVKLVVLEPGD